MSGRSSNTQNVAILELNNLSNIQYGHHLSTNAARQRQKPDYVVDPSQVFDESDNPRSAFHCNWNKTGWNVISREDNIPPVTTNPDDGSLEFNFNSKMDHLKDAILIRNFQNIRVSQKFRDKIQIKWTDKIGHHSYESIQLWINKECFGTHQPVFLDVKQRFLVDYKKQSLYRKFIGNRGTFDWSDQTGIFTAKTPIEFYFAKHISQAIPLFTGCQVKLVVICKTKVSDFVKMRALKGNDWIEIPFKWDVVENGGTYPGYGLMNKLEFPQLHARYTLMSEEEKTYYKEEKMVRVKSGTQKEEVPLTYYAEDIIYLPIKKEMGGKIAKVNLSSKLPVKAIFWVARNLNAVKNSDYCNYTTNPTDSDVGKRNPIDKVSFTYNETEKKIDNLPSYHFDEISSYFDSISPCVEVGYGFLPLCHDISSFHNAQIGLTFTQQNATMEFKLIDHVLISDSEIKKDSDEIDVDKLIEKLTSEDIKGKIENCEYEIHVILLVTKRIDFYLNGKVVIHDGNKNIEY